MQAESKKNNAIQIDGGAILIFEQIQMIFCRRKKYSHCQMRSKPVVRFSLWSNLMTGDRGQRYGGAQSVYVNDIKNRGCSQRNDGNNEVKRVCRFVGKMGFQAVSMDDDDSH